MLNVSFINMPAQDIYFICQMVDRSLKKGMAYARNIDAFMGDMSCTRLLGNYPKYTPLHEYIEYVVESVIWEDDKHDSTEVLNRYQTPFGGKLWVDYLLEAHSINISFLEWRKIQSGEIEDYFSYLHEEGYMELLLERISKEAFHILFSNKNTLKFFSEHAAFQILNGAASFAPEKFNNRGFLKRASIPQWAKTAIFHRDKGVCSNCKTDLTRLINLCKNLHFDHIIPLAKGGMNDVTNLQLLCEKCNSKKSDRCSEISTEYHSWYKYE